MEFDLHSFIKAVFCIEAAVHTATTTNGASIDMSQNGGFESLEYIISVGAAIDGDFTVSCEESDDDSVWAAVPTDEVLGTNPVVIVTAHTDSVARIGSIGKKRYQRCVLTETAANTAGIVGVNAILGNPKVGPVAGQATA